jgi:hypothetical protein
MRALRQQLRNEALSLTDAFELDGNSVDRLLETLHAVIPECRLSAPQ